MEKETDHRQIIELLKSNGLPYEDIVSSKVQFITKEANGNLIGCVGMEKYGEDGLLRSLAVNNHYKNTGVGETLLVELFHKSKIAGIKKIHLLTTTADTYFEKYGFKITVRSNAPEQILQSKEFSQICPASSTYMTLDIK